MSESSEALYEAAGGGNARDPLKTAMQRRQSDPVTLPASRFGDPGIQRVRNRQLGPFDRHLYEQDLQWN